MKDNKHIQSFNEHQKNLNISDVMFSFYENKYGMLPQDKYTNEELVIKSFEAEFGNNTTTVKQRLDFANELSKETGFSKDFILGLIKNKN
jgi:hypothetical protein